MQRTKNPTVQDVPPAMPRHQKMRILSRWQIDLVLDDEFFFLDLRNKWFWFRIWKKHKGMPRWCAGTFRLEGLPCFRPCYCLIWGLTRRLPVRGKTGNTMVIAVSHIIFLQIWERNTMISMLCNTCVHKVRLNPFFFFFFSRRQDFARLGAY
jgi:hypothetical protein